jgi:D-glycero-alpha-D-manno-heptose-7-phosphate kinase
VIRVTAWCRADLAGGTLDIWPLGVLHPRARTVNVALDLAVEVRLAPRAAGYSVRQGTERVEAATAAELRSVTGTALLGELALAGELPPSDLELNSASPRGAGLGASSALTVALLAAAELAAGGELSRTASERAALARDLEARLMGLPTGKQDHYPAQLGGALEIEHAPGGEKLSRLDVDLEALGERMVVAYTGQSHFSAGANWQVIRRRLEGDAEIVARLDEIRDVAERIPKSLQHSDWEETGRLVAAEWRARRGLSSEVSTPMIEELLASGLALGGWGGKAGGAGGGGCVFLFAPPDRRSAIEAAWTSAGASILRARPTPRSLEASLVAEA